MRFSESATLISSNRNIGCHFFTEIRNEFFLNGIWGSGGFRRVGSGVRIRRLLTRASGTLLTSRLGRHKILDFGRGHADMVSHVGPFLGHFWSNCGAFLVKQIVADLRTQSLANRAPICALKIFQILHRLECSKSIPGAWF